MAENGDDDGRDQYRSFWEQMCNDLMQRLIAYALTLANGRTCDAEDLVQETVCRVLMYPKNPEEVNNPLGYLRTIMLHAWSTKWRKEGAADTESLEELLNRGIEPAAEEDVQRFLENNEHRAIMRANLGPLTFDEKLLLRLRLEGHGCKEIADMLGEDVSLVRVRWNALRTKIISRIRRSLGL